MTILSPPFASRSPHLLGFLVALALLIGIAAPRCTAAQPAESHGSTAADLKAQYERAVSLYNSGQYDKAIEEFQAVYQIRPAPILIFNLAQAHRKAGHKAQALDLYQRFLRENQPPDAKQRAEMEQYQKLKAETEQYIDELKMGIEADKAAEKAAAEKAAAEKAAAEKAAAEKAAADKAAAEQASAQYHRKYGPKRPLNIAKWVTAGVGVALIIAGGVLIGLDGRPVCDPAMPQVDGQILCPNELDTKLTGIGILSGGAAVVGASVALFILDYKQLRDAPKPPALAFNVSF